MLAALVQNRRAWFRCAPQQRTTTFPCSFARSIQHDLFPCELSRARVAPTAAYVRLAVDPRTTSLLKLVEAVQGPVLMPPPSIAGDVRPCPRMAERHFNPVWCNAERVLRAY